MKAYLTIVRDAFHAALASKVLYVMLGIIVLALLAIAPIGYRELRDYRVDNGDIRDPGRIVERLREASASDEPSNLKRVWLAISESSREQLETLLESSQNENDPFADSRRQGRLRQVLASQLRQAIEKDDLIDRELLTIDEDAEELQELSQAMDLQDDRLKRFNRLALESLFPYEIAPSGDTFLLFGYLGFEPFEGLSASQSQFKAFSMITIPVLLDKFVLSIGVLVAVLFTANMVPELLEPGSLNLLLSKPLRRSGLFLSRFVGACAFTLLNGLAMFVGLWLILGFRLGIWNIAFLACIPIYVFVFAIYYSVSAFVGLLTRSAILSVVAAALFWLFCFLIGNLYGWTGSFISIVEPSAVVITEKQPMIVDQARHASTLVADNTWTSTFQPPEIDEVPGFVSGLISPAVLAGPVYLPTQDRFLIASPGIDDGPVGRAELKLIVAGEDTQWHGVAMQNAPTYTVDVFMLDERTLGLLTLYGEFYRIDVDQLQAAQKNESPDVLLEAPESIDEGTGQPVEVDSSQEVADDAVDSSMAFENISPYSALPSGAVAIRAYDAQTRSFAFVHEGDLLVARYNGERFEIDTKSQFSIGGDLNIERITFGGGLVYLALRDHVLVVDLVKGQVRKQEWNGVSIKRMEADSDGNGALVLDAHDRLWRLLNDGRVATVSASGNGRIKAIGRDETGSIWAIDRYYAIQRIDVSTGTSSDFEQLPHGIGVSIYRYFLSPVYTVTPKPGEFYNLVRLLASKMDRPSADDTDSEDDSRDSRRTERFIEENIGRDAWSPLINGGLFIALMLTLSVLLFRRLDM
ncbi:MAG: ABC transporter permease subunit [Planctomycetales bacterium]|nr:ABC transporter permease subunit [Planctomycetales bacterium]